ncbi:MAG: DUF3592 domain-containing protein [bacterium]|nr:DUF3592 domain-containing protein [bacterium]
MASKLRRKFLGAVFVFLFGAPFAAVGVFATWSSASQLWRWHEVRSWDVVDARVLDADLQVNSGDGDTYRVLATYEYFVAGERHVSEQVGLSNWSDNLGRFHHNAHRELSEARAAGRPVPCWVNPAQPGQAYLYPQLRWGLLLFKSLFAVIFGGVGFAVMIAAFRGGKKARKAETIRTQEPERPWHWREDWREGRVKSGSRAAAVGMCAFAVLWNLISAPVAVFLPEEVFRKGNHLAALGFIFPVIGMLLLYWGLRAVLRHRRFGGAVFEMDAVPGVIGGRLSGRIAVPAYVESERGINLTLSCMRREVTGSGKNRRTSERVLWQDARTVPREAIASGPMRTSLPVTFDIPYGLQSSTDPTENERTLWKLTAQAKIRGADLDTSFEIPVFETPESDPQFEPTREPIATTEAEIIDQLAAIGVVAETLPEGGRSFLFKAARHKGAAIGSTFFLLLWTGAIVLMLRLGAPLLFPIVFGLFELLIVWVAMDLWFSVRRVRASRRGLELSGGLFGLGKPKLFEPDRIDKLEPVRGMQVGNRLYYRIKLGTPDGREYVAATMLDNLAVARQVVSELRSSLEA